MRQLATIVILLLATTCLAQADKEVFRQVMEDYVLDYRPPHLRTSRAITVVILTNATYDIQLQSDDFDRFRERYKKLDRSTFEDFLKKVNKDFTSADTSIRNTRIVMLDKGQTPDYRELYRIYPDYDGRILEFSNVGFNSNGDQAFVYYGWQLGPVGGGVYLLYNRKGTRWKLIRKFGAWAA
jgi:hypothetical protein